MPEVIAVFRKAEGKRTDLVNMGPGINGPGDSFWVDAKITEELRPKE